MNAFYLIGADKITAAIQYAQANDLPNHISLTAVYSNDGSKAIVQVVWPEAGIEWLNENATFLGELQEDGQAPQAVYDELTKPEWQPPME